MKTSGQRRKALHLSYCFYFLGLGIFSCGFIFPAAASAVPSGPLNGSSNATEDLDVAEEGAEVERLNDPFESVNRSIFAFNDTVDVYLLEPVAKGYKAALPAPIRRCVRNFFNNAKTPVYVLSDLVQLKFSQAGEHTGRFLINSTLGFLGLADAATTLFTPHKDADFGIALGYNGVKEGPYIVIPILGPSNVRDVVGRVVDTFVNPISYVASAFDADDFVVYGSYALDGIDQRARLIDAVESAKESSTDYYSFIQSTYHQVRQNQIYDNDPPED